VLERLEALLRIRGRMIGFRQQVKVPLQEMESRTNKFVLKESKKLCQASLKAIESDIAQTEKVIQEVLQSDEELKRLMKLITSVDGIGPITACEIILTTAEFKQISDPKKFACYAGVAPFEHSSGKKLSRARVSHMANKKVKRFLHMEAMSSIRSKSDLKNYYERKVREGRNKMLIINAVRNKLIHRVFACVRDNRPYQDHYLNTLAI
jgi:transposase